MEHFCTLFDSGFLPMGLCLHSSLEQHAKNYHLWILCMDESVEDHLNKLALPNVSLVPLRNFETEAMRNVKQNRSRGEYCWTLTPFLPQYVLEHAQNIKRATYLDADIFFFQDPQIIFSEFEKSGKAALITEHAFAPEYEQSELSGRFCVQFMPFTNSSAAREILKWWQDKCIEWCFARHEEGKFGDQKYLDVWPVIFPDKVHILENKSLTLAPWNVRHFLKIDRSCSPVFFHFHGLRIGENSVRLFSGYKIGPARKSFYSTYIECLIRQIIRMQESEIFIKTTLPYLSNLEKIKSKLRILRGREEFISYKL